MANNRMFLVCNLCWPTNKMLPLKGAYCLGTYVPGYSYANDNYDKLAGFITEHQHGAIEYPLRLEYESPFKPPCNSDCLMNSDPAFNWEGTCGYCGGIRE